MYKHEIENEIHSGDKFRRAGWPKDQYLKKSPVEVIELNEDEAKAAGIDADTQVTVGSDVFILVQGSKRATLGYRFTSEDNASQDWELVIGKR